MEDLDLQQQLSTFWSLGKWALSLISFSNFFHIFEFSTAGDVMLLLPELPPHHSFAVNLWGIDPRNFLSFCDTKILRQHIF